MNENSLIEKKNIISLDKNQLSRTEKIPINERFPVELNQD